VYFQVPTYLQLFVFEELQQSKEIDFVKNWFCVEIRVDFLDYQIIRSTDNFYSPHK